MVVNGEKSEWGRITSDIPQRSLLGPLLFILYINDFPDIVQSSILRFAEDATLYSQVIEIEDQDNMNQWSKTWLLNFHPDKGKVLRISNGDAEE